jgi:hypothetical protein
LLQKQLQECEKWRIIRRHLNKVRNGSPAGPSTTLLMGCPTGNTKANEALIATASLERAQSMVEKFLAKAS